MQSWLKIYKLWGCGGVVNHNRLSLKAAFCREAD